MNIYYNSSWLHDRMWQQNHFSAKQADFMGMRLEKHSTVTYIPENSVRQYTTLSQACSFRSKLCIA